MRNLLIGLCALSIVAIIVFMMMGLWLNDMRWGGTAYICLFVAIASGAAATYPGRSKG